MREKFRLREIRVSVVEGEKIRFFDDSDEDFDRIEEFDLFIGMKKYYEKNDEERE